MIKYTGFFCVIVLLCSFTFTVHSQDTTGAVVPDVGIDSVRKNKFLLYPGFGVSLVRNDLAPVFYINVGINHEDRYEINVNTSSIFFFERGTDKNYKVYRNTFLNAEFLLNFSVFNKKERDFNGLGIGYLIESKGQYFREATMMVYYKRKFKVFSVMPGILLADDFKEVFPVISIRL